MLEFGGLCDLSVALLQDDRVMGVSRQAPTERLAHPAVGLPSLRRLERRGGRGVRTLIHKMLLLGVFGSRSKTVWISPFVGGEGILDGRNPLWNVTLHHDTTTVHFGVCNRVYCAQVHGTL